MVCLMVIGAKVTDFTDFLDLTDLRTCTLIALCLLPFAKTTN